MPSRPNRRRSTRTKKRELVSADAIAALYDIGPYDRNQISLSQINRLRELVDTRGGPRAAELVGVCEVTLLRVCAGFGHRLQPPTAAKLREWFAGKASS